MDLLGPSFKTVKNFYQFAGTANMMSKHQDDSISLDFSLLKAFNLTNLTLMHIHTSLICGTEDNSCRNVSYYIYLPSGSALEIY